MIFRAIRHSPDLRGFSVQAVNSTLGDLYRIRYRTAKESLSSAHTHVVNLNQNTQASTTAGFYFKLKYLYEKARLSKFELDNFHIYDNR